MARWLCALVGLSLVAVACGSEDSSADGVPNPGATTDTDRSAVPLEAVVFDTFDGGSLPLSEATPADIERLLDVIAPIDEPRYQPAADADWLRDDDLVIGIIGADGMAWAYPHRVLDLHELVTDEIASVPVLVTYCPLCRSGVVYDRRIDVLRFSGELTFGNTSALYQNDLVMVDHQTGSYWWQVAGRAIVGALTDVELTVLPSHTTRWSEWLAAHPATMVLADDQGFDRDYRVDRFAGYDRAVDEGRTPFPVDAEFLDDERLSSATRVIGFEGDGFAVAVPADGADQVVAVERGGEVFEVRRSGGGPSVWLVTDATAAEPYPSRSTFWFAYLSAFPDAEVEGA